MRQQERERQGDCQSRKCKWRRLFFKRVMRKSSAASQPSEAATLIGEEASQAESSAGDSQQLQLFDFSFVNE